jgi:hypothetical protein
VNRLTCRLLASLVLCGALMLTSCDSPVTASRIDPSFGTNGTLTVPSTYGQLTIVPLPDGGMLTQDTANANAPLERRTSTGAKATGWTEPRSGPGPAIGGFTDGTVLAAAKRGSTDVIGRYGPTGAAMADLGTLSRPGQGHSYSIDDDRIVAATACDAAGACDTTTVDEFQADGTVTRLSVAFGDLRGIGGHACGVNNSAGTETHRMSDGSILVAIDWCSSTNDDPSVVVRRLAPDGTVDSSYGGGAGFAALYGYPIDAPISTTGQIAIMTTTTLRRLTPTGVPDTTFGVFTLPPTLEGAGSPLLSIVANGNGYSIARKSDGLHRGNAPATVSHIGPDAKPIGPVATFADDLYPHLVRNLDGSLLAVSPVHLTLTSSDIHLTKLIP